MIELAAVLIDPAPYEKIGEERTFDVEVTPLKLLTREIVRSRDRSRMARNRVSLIGVGVDLATYDPSWQTVAATNFNWRRPDGHTRQNTVTGNGRCG